MILVFSQLFNRLTSLCAFHVDFMTFSPWQHIHVYSCTCAGLTLRLFFMTVMLHPTPLGEPKSRKLAKFIAKLIRRSVSQLIRRSVSELIRRSVSDLIRRSVSDLIKRSVSDLIWRSVSDLIWRSVSELIRRSVSHLIRRSVSHLIRRSVSDLIRRSVSYAWMNERSPEVLCWTVKVERG